MFSAIFIGNIFDILAQTGWVARAVLGLLLFFSLISWALIFQKLGIFGRVRRDSTQFLRLFRATKGVANPQGLVSAGSPFSNVYAAGYPNNRQIFCSPSELFRHTPHLYSFDHVPRVC